MLGLHLSAELSWWGSGPPQRRVPGLLHHQQPLLLQHRIRAPTGRWIVVWSALSRASAPVPHFKGPKLSKPLFLWEIHEKCSVFLFFFCSLSFRAVGRSVWPTPSPNRSVSSTFDPATLDRWRPWGMLPWQLTLERGREERRRRKGRGQELPCPVSCIESSKQHSGMVGRNSNTYIIVEYSGVTCMLRDIVFLAGSREKIVSAMYRATALLICTKGTHNYNIMELVCIFYVSFIIIYLLALLCLRYRSSSSLLHQPASCEEIQGGSHLSGHWVLAVAAHQQARPRVPCTYKNLISSQK